MSSAPSRSDPSASITFRIAQYFEPLTRLGAILFGASYCAGFVIVTLHHSQFGIAELSLLKVRVLAAGVLFAALTLLPVIGTARLYGMFGLDAPSAIAIKHRPEDRGLQQLTLGLGLYQLCFGLALGTEVVFDDNVLPHPWALLVAAPILLGLAPIIGRHFSEHPRKCVALMAGIMIGLGWLAAVGWGTPFLMRTFWFYCCSLTTLWMRNSLREPQGLKRLELERFVAVPLGVLMMFAVFVYGSAKPRFGGGRPTPILLHVSAEAAPIVGGEQVPVWLLDQTDYAIYVLRSPEATKCVLLPRNSARAIEFNYAPPIGWVKQEVRPRTAQYHPAEVRSAVPMTP